MYMPELEKLHTFHQETSPWILVLHQHVQDTLDGQSLGPRGLSCLEHRQIFHGTRLEERTNRVFHIETTKADDMILETWAGTVPADNLRGCETDTKAHKSAEKVKCVSSEEKCSWCAALHCAACSHISFLSLSHLTLSHLLSLSSFSTSLSISLSSLSSLSHLSSLSFWRFLTTRI